MSSAPRRSAALRIGAGPGIRPLRGRAAARRGDALLSHCPVKTDCADSSTPGFKCGHAVIGSPLEGEPSGAAPEKAAACDGRGPSVSPSGRSPGPAPGILLSLIVAIVVAAVLLRRRRSTRIAILVRGTRQFAMSTGVMWSLPAQGFDRDGMTSRFAWMLPGAFGRSTGHGIHCDNIDSSRAGYPRGWCPPPT